MKTDPPSNSPRATVRIALPLPAVAAHAAVLPLAPRRCRSVARPGRRAHRSPESRRPSPPGTPMLEARGLCKSYGSRAVVSDLSLTVAGGEIVGLLGPNGAGKSTTVAMLCGLVDADAGEVFVGEGAARQRLTGRSREPQRRIGV